MHRWRLAASLILVGVLAASSGYATTITLSDMSSDLTPASSLDATLDFSVLGGNTLQLVVTNDTLAPNEFNINGVWWNASSDVSGLLLTSAMHSVSGDVLAAWDPIEVNSMVDGFGVFDFGLTDGVGATNTDIAHPGDSITFLMTISGACAGTCDMADFFVGNGAGKVAAAMFVNGPDDPESPGNEDSAFGAAVPEPATGSLLALGLIGLAARRSGARRH